MSDKQYRVARKGVVEQIKLAQRLHCKQVELTTGMAMMLALVASMTMKRNLTLISKRSQTRKLPLSLKMLSN